MKDLRLKLLEAKKKNQLTNVVIANILGVSSSYICKLFNLDKDLKIASPLAIKIEHLLKTQSELFLNYRLSSAEKRICYLENKIKNLINFIK